MSETRIASFVVRFIQETAAELADPADAGGGRLAADWRGVIRHVQSRQELRFTELKEALDFMDRYVALTDPEVAEEDGCD
ncbi:MAG TPA: hypothetical protein VK879_06675 [Candidatus Sulfomarinibacteraceae bacterium]|nr:hypothetical protein [Candidatus Sulfomarinibacteraceae bacterium]